MNTVSTVRTGSGASSDSAERAPKNGKNGKNGNNGKRSAAAIGVAHALRPSSIAVIGASRTRGTPGAELLHNLVAGGFTGAIYAVHPAAEELGGQLDGVAAYRTLAEIPGDVEMAVIAVPAAAVPQVADACGAKGVKALVVISAGFAEAGPEGAALQQDLLAICRWSGMRLIGPNCMGVLNTHPDVRMHATFSPVAPLPGRAALVSQSGGLGVAAMALADDVDLGLSVFVSIGNRADISPNDVLEFLEQDDGTDVALLYVEGFGNPRKFARIARRVSATRPIVTVKGGRSAAGALATASHTGALVAASDATVDALFRQAGMLRADSLEELLDIATVLANHPLPAGPKVAIIANAGGLGVLAVDACEGSGLVVPEFSAGLREAILRLRPGASTRNPVDLLAGASGEVFEEIVRMVAESGEVDSILAVCVSPIAGGSDDAAVRLKRLATDPPAGLPLIPVSVGNEPDDPGKCVFGAPERAVHALGHAWQYKAWRSSNRGHVPSLPGINVEAARAIVADAIEAGGGWLTPTAVDRLLRCYGVPMVTTRTASGPAAVGAVAADIGGPVAIKALGPTLLHKTDAGAVILGVEPAQAQAQATAMVERLTAAGHGVTGLVVQAMASPGVELIVGVVHDKTFGPVVAVGAGGVLTEVLHDVTLRLTPLADRDAVSMLADLRTYRLLTGYRGAPPTDLAAVHDVLLRVGRMADDLPDILEMDCNPVVASPEGAIVLDARVRITGR